MYNALFSKRHQGTLILRVEDTDLERSSREFEKTQRADLRWLGLDFEEGPEIGGDVGPYRQSERMDLYAQVAIDLVKSGKAFYCFCSEEELERKKEQMMAQNLNPAYDGTCHKVSYDQALARMAKGETAAIRFKAIKKEYVLKDHVRDEVCFPEGMVGDFVILRSNKMPTYNFCCVVDDWKMKITHVIRGEDHLNNTLRQLMIYESLGVNPPEFAHASLLIGKDRQKLSKRHGATSVAQYREEGYLPEALLNYLCLLGWSHPEEKDVFLTKDIVSMFGFDRFSKASPIYDIEKLKYINNQHMRLLTLSELSDRYASFTSSGAFFHKATSDWRQKFLNLFREKAHTLSDFINYENEIASLEMVAGPETDEILAMPTTKQIAMWLKQVLSGLNGTSELLSDGQHHYVSDIIVGQWMDSLKNQVGVKGKPLFLGARLALTGHPHGPDLKILTSLTPVSVLHKRLEIILAKLG